MPLKLVNHGDGMVKKILRIASNWTVYIYIYIMCLLLYVNFDYHVDHFAGLDKYHRLTSWWVHRYSKG